MQNQAAVEALYSATFVEDYLDCVENLPNDLQRYLSRLREFDLTQYSEFLRDLDNLVTEFEKEKTAAGQRQVLAKIQLGLIAAQDIGDDKLATVQSMADLIENKSRQLEHDSKNLEFGQDNEEEPPTPAPPPKPLSTVKSSVKRTNDEKQEKTSAKRRKKATSEKPKEKDQGVDEDACSTTSNRSGVNRGKGVGAVSSSGGVNRKGSKRKSGGKRQVNRADSDAEIDPSVEIDPDEPTYCLCDQVSYGEMIGCDNDLCPIEWFHFNCVQLATKPKGKWYCPRCRDTKATVMKSKAAFLKELVKYNKEKEEKNVKQNN